MIAKRARRMPANGAKLSLQQALQLCETAMHGKLAASLEATIWIFRTIQLA